MRKDYAKHGNEAAQEHVRLLSATVNAQSSRVHKLETLVESKAIEVKWRLTGIAAILQEAAGRMKYYDSPKFDVFLNSNHKLFISAEIEGNQLGLYLEKDIAMSADKSTLDIVGSSITVSKAGLPDEKGTYANPALVRPPNWTCGWDPFFADITPSIEKHEQDLMHNIDLEQSKSSYDHSYLFRFMIWMIIILTICIISINLFWPN
jgi:hypothetical protein